MMKNWHNLIKNVFKKIHLLFILNFLSNCQNHQIEAERVDFENYSWKKEYFTGQAICKNNEWWGNFQDPLLNYLISEGLKYNHEILLNINNLEKAKFLAKISGGNFRLNLEGDTSRLKYSKERKDFPIDGIYNIANLNIVPSYEIDLWKRISNRKKSALSRVKFAESQIEMIRLVTAGEIAKTYFNLLSLDLKQELLKKSLSNYQELLKISKSEVDLGSKNKELINKIKVIEKTLEQKLEEISHYLVETETIMSMLIGKDPQFILERKKSWNKTLREIKILPLLQPNSPSEIIVQRPDIKMAEQLIIISNYDLAVAKTLYFPSISLNSLIGFSSNNLDKLFSGFSWKLGLNEKLTLFDRGDIKSQIEIAKLSKSKELINYSQVVRQAFKEVLDSLSLQKKSLNIFSKSSEKEKYLEELYKIHLSRYRAGYEDYTKLIDAQENLIEEKFDNIAYKQNCLNNSIDFFKIVGGNWQVNYIKKEGNDEK